MKQFFIAALACNAFFGQVLGQIAASFNVSHTGLALQMKPLSKSATPSWWIRSVHVYPFMVVVERNRMPVEHLVSEKKGTQWQPFLK